LNWLNKNQVWRLTQQRTHQLQNAWHRVRPWPSLVPPDLRRRLWCRENRHAQRGGEAAFQISNQGGVVNIAIDNDKPIKADAIDPRA
jgi:hypothetical protein